MGVTSHDLERYFISADVLPSHGQASERDEAGGGSTR
jgi:hypothetical protein